MIPRVTALAAALSLTIPQLAAAADPGLPQSSSVATPDRQFVIDLGLAASTGPRYDGSNDYLTQPKPVIGISRVRLPFLGQFGNEANKRGVFIFPSFDFIGSRDSGDDKDLTGTDHINSALALGVGVGYRYDWFRAFVQTDYGFNGYHGFRAQVGADVIGEPVSRLSLSLGPRLNVAGDDYMNTYFSVSDDEAARFRRTARGIRRERRPALGRRRGAGQLRDHRPAVRALQRPLRPPDRRRRRQPDRRRREVPTSTPSASASATASPSTPSGTRAASPINPRGRGSYAPIADLDCPSRPKAESYFAQ